MSIKKLLGLGCWVWVPPLFSWDANGHVLITQLTYTYLTPQTKAWLHAYTKTQTPAELNQTSIWLDKHRYGRYKQFSRWHYINIPYGDKRFFKPPYNTNLITAIHDARASLSSSTTSIVEKRFAIRVLIHCIEDLHQPLHTISYYSKRYKHGDKGATLWKINNKIYKGNLHHFWDNAGGWLSGLTWHNSNQVALKLKELKMKPCDWRNIKVEPEVWAKESYELARLKAYFPPRSTKKFAIYQDNVQQYSKNQIQVAACHLAATLNQIKMVSRTY